MVGEVELEVVVEVSVQVLVEEEVELEDEVVEEEKEEVVVVVDDEEVEEEESQKPGVVRETRTRQLQNRSISKYLNKWKNLPTKNSTREDTNFIQKHQ